MKNLESELKVLWLISNQVAEEACSEISEAVIKYFQAMSPTFALGDNDAKNAWDECSILLSDGDSDSPIWDAFVVTIDQAIQSQLRIKDFPAWKLCAIWMQTKPGLEWLDELEQPRIKMSDLTWCESDVVDHIRDRYVCQISWRRFCLS